MGNKLTGAQKVANACPDCGDDPREPGYHLWTCRRVAMSMPPDQHGPPEGIGKLGLQIGPPWVEWPDGVEPVNPRAAVH